MEFLIELLPIVIYKVVHTESNEEESFIRACIEENKKLHNSVNATTIVEENHRAIIIVFLTTEIISSSLHIPPTPQLRIPHTTCSSTHNQMNSVECRVEQRLIVLVIPLITHFIHSQEFQ
jgi:hypothetical protein